MDLARYRARKAKGGAALLKMDNGAVVVAYRAYDPVTGERLPDEIGGVTIATITTQRDALAAQLADIEALLAEIAALKPVK